MEYFRPSEPETPDLQKEVSRTASRVGLAFFVLMVVSTGASLLLQVLAMAFWPEALYADWFTWTVTIISLYICAAPFAWLILRNLPTQVPRKRRISPKTFFIFAFMAFTLLIGGSLIGQAINTVIGKFAGEQESQLTEVMNSSALWLSGVYSLVIAPLLEEFFFRKLLIDRMSHLGDISCILLSGLAFGLFHGNLEQFFYAALLGMLLAYLYLKTGNILYTILIHSVVNFFGGFLPALVEYFLPADFFGAETDEAFFAMVEAHPGSFFCLMAVSYLPWILSIVGLIFLALYFRRLIRGLTPSPLPVGQKVKPILANPGVILYLVVCFGMILLSIFS